MSTSYESYLVVGVPVDLWDRLPDVKACDQGHTAPRKTARAYCGTCGDKLAMQPQYAAKPLLVALAAEADEAPEDYVADAGGENGVLHYIAPSREWRGDASRYEPMVFGECVSEVADWDTDTHHLTPISRAELAETFDRVETEARDAGIENPVAMLYHTTHVSY